MSEENKGNSEIGMEAESFDQVQAPEPSQDSSSFFGALEDQVNGAIQDENTEATHQAASGSEQATHNQPQDGSNNVPQQESESAWEKRYKDSSREAVKLKEELNNLKPFVPVLDAMKQDSGLVDHVREYLVNGGKPAKSIQEHLKLPEDFVFDSQEAMTNPDSDSAKLMNAHVDGVVQQRVGQVLNAEKERAGEMQAKYKQKEQEKAFRERYKMSDEQFSTFVEQAKSHTLSLDDVHYLLNRDKAAANTANSARKDMLSQMKQVRDMPATASGANSQGTKDPDGDIFDGILGLDSGKDNLFG